MSVPKPEYPRPDFDRSDRWLTLNGEWSFEPTAGGAETILVPFAWETEASGVRRTWLEAATYSRSLTVPQEWASFRVVLNFGAVHHSARVFIDGALIGTHSGGYTSFEFDITELVVPGRSAELAVEVHAPADKRQIPHGKQRSIPRDDYDGVSFTPTSGIWQSVWLEARGRTYLSAAQLRGDSLTAIAVHGSLVGDRPADTVVIARVDGQEAAFRTDAEGRFGGQIELRDPKTWSPEHPYLYEVDFTVGTGAGADHVRATTGLRRIETRGEELYLNGDRLYVRGVLDQGYWSESGLTAPTDAALLHDLELAQELGFNLVRKHLKFEEPRWLHYADQMGMLTWCEPACPSRYSPAAAAAFEAQLPDLVRRDGNHPSIVVWGLYNEEWGLDWDIPGSPERAAAATHAYDVMRKLDDSRPIVENSGWGHVRTDLVDWHYYDEDPAAWATNVAALASGESESFEVKLGPDFIVDKGFYGDEAMPRTGIPILNSEFGAGFTSLERAWHVRWQTQEIRRHDRFAGYVYTELADVEHEMAGLLDAERRPKDWGGLTPALVNAPTVIIVDLVPERAGADIPVPGAPLRLDVRVSHHGPNRIAGVVRAAWGAAGSQLASVVTGAVADEVHAAVTPYRVSEPVALKLPAPGGPARLHIWLEVDERRIASTFIDAAPVEQPNRRGARTN
ncbi:hypothetical protein OSC27_03830 [Microbacterium sp. STN6]|uniref:glycoside hydrolase family 2 protein n=1 Tax=Microbacterium sp. STN6 TaxID=2995588 RepID=UPI0022609ECA|nr:sugar-binding domain-containing protein [Microbacterium sp. STN6]MCX7521405.1 hypothetical protein [Microbacterium sp. STN6]